MNEDEDFSFALTEHHHRLVSRFCLLAARVRMHIDELHPDRFEDIKQKLILVEGQAVIFEKTIREAPGDWPERTGDIAWTMFRTTRNVRDAVLEYEKETDVFLKRGSIQTMLALAEEVLA